MSNIIKKIQRNRLVTVLGHPGIGKTMITKSVALFLEERNKFHDGLICISLCKMYHADRLISQLYQLIKKALYVYMYLRIYVNMYR